MYSNIVEALKEGIIATLIIHLIKHPMLLTHLESFCGTKGNALIWVKSYLTDRAQCVSVTDKTSPDVGLHCYVPQRSGLRPKNYRMFTKPVCEKLINGITLNIIVVFT